MARQTYPLTLSQLMIWGAETVLVDTPPMYLCWLVRLPGGWPVSHWETVVRQIVSENEGLRLRMILQDGQVRQYVAAEEPVLLPVRDLATTDGPEALRRWVESETVRSMRLVDSPLFRFVLLRCQGQEDRLFIKVHHLVADGWSMTVLTDQVHNRHVALETGQPLAEPPTASFVHYVVQQTAARPLARARLFMQSLLERGMGPAAIHPRPDLQATANGPVERANFTVPSVLRDQIERWAGRQHSSVYLFFLSVILLYIALADKAKDAAIGTLFHNRLDAAYRHTVGLFVTVLPLRVAVGDDLRFSELVRRVLAAWKGAIQRQPENLSLRELAIVYEHAAALFDVVLSYENHLPVELPEWLPGPIALGPVSLRIALLDHASGELEMECTYKSGVYHRADIEALYSDLMALSAKLLSDPERKIGAMRAEWP